MKKATTETLLGGYNPYKAPEYHQANGLSCFQGIFPSVRNPTERVFWVWCKSSRNLRNFENSIISVYVKCWKTLKLEINIFYQLSGSLSLSLSCSLSLSLSLSLFLFPFHHHPCHCLFPSLFIFLLLHLFLLFLSISVYLSLSPIFLFHLLVFVTFSFSFSCVSFPKSLQHLSRTDIFQSHSPSISYCHTRLSFSHWFSHSFPSHSYCASCSHLSFHLTQSHF